MAETLGMLCDKLTVVKLKEYHTEDPVRLASLAKQASQLSAEIDEYLSNAMNGDIPPDRLVFDSNKVFKKVGDQLADIRGEIGELVYQLADINCRLWHEQEKVYEFEKVPVPEKDRVVKQLAILNLDRNKCIDAINNQLLGLVRARKESNNS